MLTAKKPGLLRALSSPIGRKLVTGVTGLALTGFVLMHMLGNLSYFVSPEAYNLYGSKVTGGFGLGRAVYYLIEVFLAAFFLFHIVNGIRIWLGKRKARPQGYARYQTTGGPSKQSISSRSMALTGLIILGFLIIHLWSFRFGAHYDTMAGGKEVRDLAVLMEMKFNHWYYAFGYVAVMLLLALHLRHGVWSAFQSLALTNPRLTPLIYTLGLVLGLGIALGFLVLPLYVYFFVDAPEFTASLVSGFFPLMGG